MEWDIYNKIFIVVMTFLAVVGAVIIMNYIERIVGRFIYNKLNKYRSRKRHSHNMKLIREKMSKHRAL